MKAFNLPLFWIVAVPSFSIWLAGVYFVIKGWTEKKEPGVKTEHAPAIEQPQPIPKPKIEEEIISEKEIEIQVPSITQEPSPTNEEFYAEFGKPNIVEFPAEYVSENHVRGLDGDPINAIEFAKSCYTQIGFRCLDTVFTGTKDNHVYKVSIFDLLCDHYASDEDFHISFFGENKEKLQGELASIKSSPEYVQENIAKLAAVYKDLPQLLIWNDKELFFILVKGKDESLTQKEIHWLRESVLDKKLVRAKIFRVTEKKAPEEKATTLPEENQAPQPEEKEKQTKIETKNKRLS